MHSIFLKTKIHSGIGSLQVLSAYRNQKIFLVCDEFLLSSGGVRQLLESVDDSCQVKIFHKVVPDPPMDTVAEALVQFQRFAPQVMIAMGGGSAIDTAKGVLYFSKQMPGGSDVKLIAVPTTSGTGSEVTSATVLTDPESKIKHIIVDDAIVPDEAILDARLTLSVPPNVTANTGLDVLTHALEAYVAVKSNPFSDALAEKAVEFIHSSLLACYSNGSDLEARTRMHEASTFAGIAFDKAGLGLSHSLAHQLGSVFHIPHGLANALVLKEVILFNSKDPAVCFQYADLVRRTGISAGAKKDEDAVWDLIRYIEDLKFRMKMPGTVRDCGISRAEYDNSMVTLALNTLRDWCVSSNPTKIAAEDVVKILNSVY
ncbi:1-propanol dehydrogenase PduQ [Faecalispora anaeroviscerum]|uniref:1-propanol dehydrogenase PduQ n=1 Tax=Faecalispora anaeroviscerum TaxID=2991836 RepID=UPI0024BA54C7|nr:1-propanol dehydrogenase PduQ [Faecalispora anaeroviscerum]